MPFKWARSCSRRWAEPALLAAAALAIAEPAGALTVEAARGRGTVKNGALWAAAENATNSVSITNGFFDPVDANGAAAQMDTTAAADPDGSEAIFFKVTTDKALVAGKTRIVTVRLKGDDATYRPIPIAWAGSDGTRSCDGTDCQDLNGGYYLAAKVPNNSIVVGIYPREACAVYPNILGGGSQPGDNCDHPLLLGTGTSTGPTLLPLEFHMYDADDTVGGPGAAAVLDSSTLLLNLVYKGPDTSCTDAGLSDVYFPGDQEILVKPAGVGATIGAQGTPLDKILVLWIKGGLADLVPTSAYPSKDGQRRAVISFGAASPVSPFDNTTTGSDNAYAVAFLVKDVAGIVNHNTNCQLHPVVTADIQTFLKTGKCFIATAAFGGSEGAPVRLLRGFRDRVLLRSSPGRAFVDWYYGWSPDAAGWLLEHPAARFPVLLALVPVEAAAWLLLNPAVAILLGALGVVLAAAAVALARAPRGAR
jgi:hypothetical protein